MFSTDPSGGPGVRKNIPGSLASTTAAAGQVICSYTPTPGHNGFIESISIDCRQTTYATTGLAFGTASLMVGLTVVMTFDLFGGTFQNPVTFIPASPIVVPQGQTATIVANPNAVTPFTWTANLNATEI